MLAYSGTCKNLQLYVYWKIHVVQKGKYFILRHVYIFCTRGKNMVLIEKLSFPNLALPPLQNYYIFCLDLTRIYCVYAELL